MLKILLVRCKDTKNCAASVIHTAVNLMVPFMNCITYWSRPADDIGFVIFDFTIEYVIHIGSGMMCITLPGCNGAADKNWLPW